VLCQMQTETSGLRCQRIPAFFLSPLCHSFSVFHTLSLSIPLFFCKFLALPLFFTCSHTRLVNFSLLPDHYFLCRCPLLPSPLFSSASVHSLFSAEAQRVTIPALRQTEITDGEIFRRQKKRERAIEKVLAEALQRSPSLQVQLHKRFQMCVQRFTSSADRSEPRGYNPWFNLILFPLLRPLFLALSLVPLLQSGYSSHVMRCSGYQRQECTHAQHNPPIPSLTSGIYRELKSAKEGSITACVCVCVCVYTSVTQWSGSDLLRPRHQL